MNEATSSLTLGTLASYTLYGLGAPIGADVGEHHTAVGQQVTEEHRHAVQEVVLRSQRIGLTRSVPVERGTHQRLGEVEVGLVVCPLALSLHTGSNGVVADGFFLIAHLEQLLRTLHQVADNHHVLHRELPVLVLLLAVLTLALAVEGSHGHAGEQRTVLVVVVTLLGLAVFLHPSHSLGKLLLVVDTEIDAAQYFYQRDVFRTHAKILLQEVGINDRTGNTHASIAKRQVRLTAHRSNSLCSTGKAQNLLCHVSRNRIVVQVLYVVTIDAVGGQSLLGMGGKDGSQINGARTLRTVEAPDSLRIGGVHVHGLGTIAPARSHGNGTADTLAFKLGCTGSTLADTANRRL